MQSTCTVIVGCGDIGRRISRQLIKQRTPKDRILALNASAAGSLLCSNLGLKTRVLNFDEDVVLPLELDNAEIFYLVPPQKEGVEDNRCRRFIEAMCSANMTPAKVILFSTTGVYGDQGGDWVSEETEVHPETDRARRRLDLEQQWRQWSRTAKFLLNVLRVPGIYAYDRLPVKRLQSGSPVVAAEQCGFSNRIHAEDLTTVAIAAMQLEVAGETINASDGVPATITEYLQEAAQALGFPRLPQISMQEAEQAVSAEMLSYLRESRKVSNQKMLQKLKVALRYPDFRVGIRH